MTAVDWKRCRPLFLVNVKLKQSLEFFFLCATLTFLPACFDYHERLRLKQDLSGNASISYTVPVSKEGISQLAFLPSTEEAIKAQYEEARTKLRFRIRDIKINSLDSTDREAKPQTKQEAQRVKISYRLEFEDPEILEHTPLKNAKVLRSRKTLEIKRSFPVIENKRQSKGIILKRISKYMRRRFSGHSISYSLSFPKGFELSTNQGRLHKNREHTYELPLVKTLSSAQDRRWSLILKRK